MNYEQDLELCEYNPISIAYQDELRALSKIAEVPMVNLFQKILDKIVTTHTVKA